ncbi:MAG: VOC family protein [Firmicutes bacterium]|mgnify:CR=1 FL=1|nr:VOC family protein [Bacillota bacterium]
MSKQGEIIGLAHIGVHTDDLEKSIEFYESVLGFTLDYTAEVRSGAVKLAFLTKGSCIIELIHNTLENIAASRQAGIIDHVALGVKDISELTARLAEQGVSYETKEPMSLDVRGGVRTIFFYGPSGERLEFFEYL